jgi:hypothetical protein
MAQADSTRVELGETFGCTASTFSWGRAGDAVQSWVLCTVRPEFPKSMEAFLVSTGIVALAEMGDKTQLLAAHPGRAFSQALAHCLGILVATMANHALAGAAGAWVTTCWGRMCCAGFWAVSFIAMAVWMLIPDQLDDGDDDGKAPRLGMFGTTVVAFLPGRNGRQDADRHRHAGRPVPSLVLGWWPEPRWA